MDASPKTYRRAAPAGLILAPVAWVIDQQFTSELVYVKCEAASATRVISIGVICALVAMVGILLSRWARRRVTADSIISFIATLGTLSGVVFLLVIIAGTLSGLLLPACFR